jgi:hypothetical protein
MPKKRFIGVGGTPACKRPAGLTTVEAARAGSDEIDDYIEDSNNTASFSQSTGEESGIFGDASSSLSPSSSSSSSSVKFFSGGAGGDGQNTEDEQTAELFVRDAEGDDDTVAVSSSSSQKMTTFTFTFTWSETNADNNADNNNDNNDDNALSALSFLFNNQNDYPLMSTILTTSPFVSPSTPPPPPLSLL